MTSEAPVEEVPAEGEMPMLGAVAETPFDQELAFD